MIIFCDRYCLKMPCSKACWGLNGYIFNCQWTLDACWHWHVSLGAWFPSKIRWQQKQCSNTYHLQRKTSKSIGWHIFYSFPDKIVGSQSKHNAKEMQCPNHFHMHCVGSLPSTIAKFLNPMASNRRLTISDNSGIYEKEEQTISVETIKWQKFSKRWYAHWCKI